MVTVKSDSNLKANVSSSIISEFIEVLSVVQQSPERRLLADLRFTAPTLKEAERGLNVLYSYTSVLHCHTNKYTDTDSLSLVCVYLAGGGRTQIFTAVKVVILKYSSESCIQTLT